MHDSLLEDQGHLDDPHLWERAERLGLDLERFEEDRRSAAVNDSIEERLPVGHPGRSGHDADPVRGWRAVPRRARRSAPIGAFLKRPGWGPYRPAMRERSCKFRPDRAFQALTAIKGHG